MTAMISASAVHDAWALYRQPVLSRKLSRMNFHPDMLELIKIAAGDDETIRKWSEEIGTDADHLQDAAAFYLQQVMGRPGNDAYGTIGLAADASALDIKNHKRWLLKWLHPDRNPSVWRQSLYRKVTAAAEQIEGKGPAVIPLALSHTCSAWTTKAAQQLPPHACCQLETIGVAGFQGFTVVCRYRTRHFCLNEFVAEFTILRFQ
jgi:hypothetical protein